MSVKINSSTTKRLEMMTMTEDERYIDNLCGELRINGELVDSYVGWFGEYDSVPPGGHLQIDGMFTKEELINIARICFKDSELQPEQDSIDTDASVLTAVA